MHLFRHPNDNRDFEFSHASTSLLIVVQRYSRSREEVRMLSIPPLRTEYGHTRRTGEMEHPPHRVEGAPEEVDPWTEHLLMTAETIGGGSSLLHRPPSAVAEKGAVALWLGQSGFARTAAALGASGSGCARTSAGFPAGSPVRDGVSRFDLAQHPRIRQSAPP